MKNEIITFTSPKASVSEIFRTLRTNVQFMIASNEQKSILFTSTQAGEGKSWITANLAITFAQAGKKVILVDTDMRRGRQHQIFDIPNNKGLSNYLILSVKDSEETLNEYIHPTMIDNLYVITSGIVPPNPSELLTSKKMLDLMNALEQVADIVIYDSTPSTMVTDAMAITRYVGSTIIVASHKTTKMEVLKQIKKNIENVGGKVAGVIFNKVPLSKREYGKSYYYESSITINEKKLKMSKMKDLFSVNKVADSSKIESVRKETFAKVENDKQTVSTEDIDELLNELSEYINKKNS